jgi:hypothetical protein
MHQELTSTASGMTLVRTDGSAGADAVKGARGVPDAEGRDQVRVPRLVNKMVDQILMFWTARDERPHRSSASSTLWY